MEGKAWPLIFIYLLSLKEITLRKLASTLWTDSGVLASIMELQCHENSRRKWESIIARIKEKIKTLRLPESLSQQMFDTALNVGSEIRRWEHFHVKTFNLSCSETFELASEKLCFTPAGTVDYRRMAQGIVLCSKIDVVQRYRIACSYWLEDFIPLLWQELKEKDKKYFSRKNLISKGLEFAWPYTSQDGLDRTWRKSVSCSISFKQWAFKLSAKQGYKATAECFFQKLSCKEREACLMRTARLVGSKVEKSKRYSNVLHSLLSLMTPLQQLEIVKELPVSVLSCFLDWPRQDLFSANAGLIRPYLTLEQCVSLLKLAIHRVVTWNNNFPKIFSSFLEESTSHFKDYFVNQDGGAYCFLRRCFCSGDTESIKAIFRSLDSIDRVKLLFRVKVLKLFYHATSHDRWNLVELCLEEALLPGKERKRLYRTFRDYLNTEFSSRQDRFDQIFHSLESIQRDHKTRPSRLFLNFVKKPLTKHGRVTRSQKPKLED